MMSFHGDLLESSNCGIIRVTHFDKCSETSKICEIMWTKDIKQNKNVVYSFKDI